MRDSGRTYCHRRRYSVLLSIGKEHLYVWEKTEGMLHEDEGAERLRRIT